MVLILLDHSFYTAQQYHLIPIGIQLGNIGVAIFFFVSGYLAKYTLKKPFDLKRFVTDKLLRLYPLYVCAVIIAWLWMDWIPVEDLGVAFLSMTNIFVTDQSGFLWFVAAIFWTYMLFAAYAWKWWLAIPLALLMFALLDMAGNPGIIRNVIIFFLGATCSRWLHLEKLNVFESKVVDKLGNATYPMYLFHPAIWNGLVAVYYDLWVFYLIYFPLMMVASVLIQDRYNDLVRLAKKHLTARPGQAPAH